MIQIGKIALILWAAAFLYIGYLLIAGQSAVALTAIENGRIGEAISQFLFCTLVLIGTLTACGLFLVVGVFRE